ncbi:MAG: hypothetical protein JNK60_17120 [Acidobacteria bacterium]|nr:hypothetical protein [Acidobacteriota bacterium]
MRVLVCVALVVASNLVVAQAPGKLNADGTVSAERPVLACPLEQKKVAKSARPDPELFKKIIRCHKGERAVVPHAEGPVTIDVTALQVGTPRKWSYRQDSGSGDESTMVYPVRATYTERTYYRTRTEFGEDWIRVLNFYVDSFGEWRIGSEEPVKPPVVRSVPRR